VNKKTCRDEMANMLAAMKLDNEKRELELRLRLKMKEKRQWKLERQEEKERWQEEIRKKWL